MARKTPRMFYVLLGAIPITAVAVVASFARLFDASDAGGAAPRARGQPIALSLLLAALVVAAGIASPLS